jgi:hypothetical protein
MAIAATFAEACQQQAYIAAVQICPATSLMSEAKPRQHLAVACLNLGDRKL